MTIIEKFGIGGDAKGANIDAPARMRPDFTFGHYVKRLWRHRRILGGTIGLLTGIAALIVFQMTPSYRGEAMIMTAVPQTNVVKIETVLRGLPFGQDTINSEMTVIRSYSLASRVVEKLRLYEDPEFNAPLRPKKGLWHWITGRFDLEDKPVLPKEQRKALERATVVRKLQSHLKVSAVVQSRVIQLGVSSSDPAKATLITNTFAELYLLEQLEAKFEATKRASDWLGIRITELRTAVEKSERAVELYRRQHGLIKGKDDLTTAAAQISALTNQLVDARAKRAEIEARLAQIERLLRSRRRIESAAQVLSSPLIQRLRERESTVIGKLAELRAEFGPKHPKMIAVRAELADLRSKIRSEVVKIVERERGEARVARAREESLRKSLTQMEQRVSLLNEKSVRLRTLEREARANRTLLETVLSRFKETSTQRGLQTADARIIASATIPTAPYFPNKPLIIGLAFAGACIIGLMLIALIEHLDAGFRSGDQIESDTGIPALGLIPEVSARQLKGQSIKDYLVSQPVSAYSEAIRSFQVSLALSDVDSPPKSVMVTSTTPEEGKSVLAYSLATIAAQSGRKVLLIDCDLRRPQQHEIAGIKRRPGLVEILSEKATMDRVIHKEQRSRLDIVPAGDVVPNPTDLLGSEHMRSILEHVTKTYDLVVIDCPPSVAVSDARVLGNAVDGVIFAVRWAKTRRESAKFAIRKLADSGASIAGCVLTRVDVKRHADYDFGDSGSYSGRYSKYYTS